MEQAKIKGIEIPEGMSQIDKNKLLASSVDAHGFCLACMMHCHEGHEVHELYSKLDFRCDCGNSRMPWGCQIDAENLAIKEQQIAKLDNKEQGNVDNRQLEPCEKDYTNPDNRYSETFFDIYCHCKKPYSSEDIKNFMIQCYVCEDWFHNHHLLPPIL